MRPSISPLSTPILLAALVASTGCIASEASLDENLMEESAELAFLPKVTPDLAIQIRTVDLATGTFGCLDAASAATAAEDIESQFRASTAPNAIAEARCVVPVGATFEATTIGVWSVAPTLIDFNASLAQLDILGGDLTLLPAAIGTWVSRRFMQAQVAAESQSTAEFDVQFTDVVNLFPATGRDFIQTRVEGETLGTTIAWDVEVEWNEALVARSLQATHPGYPTNEGCPRVAAAFSTSTNRVFRSLIPDGQLEAGFPETGVVAALVDRGLYPSRLLVAPQDAQSPLVDSILHLGYSNSDIEVIGSGLLEGLIVVAKNNRLEDRAPCAKIRRPTGIIPVLKTYEASTFDLRAPLTFAWTSSANINVLSPTQPSTRVFFTNSAPGTLDLRVTDADGVVRIHRRNISSTNP